MITKKDSLIRLYHSPSSNFRMLWWGAFLLIFILSGCSNKQAIQEDKFVKIYTDIIIAQDTSNAGGAELERIKQEVFKKYNINEKQYTNTLDYMNSKPERWEKFFNDAISYVEKMKKQSRK
jgi:Domain of unknown function (DUF4296)